MSQEVEKRAAANAAADLVEDGMLVGLGSGSTAEMLVEALGTRCRQGLRFRAVPTSEETRLLAARLGIPLTTLDEVERLDIAIDGADEVDPELNLIKGHGGALLREKLVAEAAREFVVIVDETKLVDHLQERFSIPVEVVSFGWKTTWRRLEALGISGELRGGPSPYTTDSGNVIIDCRTGGDDLDWPSLAAAIKAQTGVVEHGLFLAMTSRVVVGEAEGGVRISGA